MRPARFCLPTPRGLAEALGLAQPRGLEDEAVALHNVARALMAELGATTPDPRLSRLAWTMAKAGWSWGPAVLGTLGLASEAGDKGSGLDVWAKLPEWQDYAPPPPPGSEPVEPAEARKRLAQLLGEGCGSKAAAGGLRLGRLPPPSHPAWRRASRNSCWRKRARAWARRWAISRPPACGPSAMTARCGSRHSPATCSTRSMASSTGSIPPAAARSKRPSSARAARTISAC